MKDDIKHILRYGTNADQKYIEKLKKTFSTLAINGNMIAYTPEAIAGFVSNLIWEKGHVTGYFIDPITHAFQHDVKTIMSYSKKTEKLGIKESIVNLINYYGDPLISSVLNNSTPITPKDFADSLVKTEFCKNVLDFQLSTIPRQLNEKGLTKYINYMDNGAELFSLLRPCFVIPPYFYIDKSDENYREWLKLNVEFIKISKKLLPDTELYAQLVISKEILESDDSINEICNQYINELPDGILLWIDDFDEHKVDTDLLIGYLKLIKKLYDSNIKIYNLYGSFFSVMLTGFEKELGLKLSGVGHALDYGESRAVVPVGGGIPTNKYYYYPLHHRLEYKKASSLLKSLGYFTKDTRIGAEMYKNTLCGCRACVDAIADNINNFTKFENTEFYEVILKGIKQRRTYANQDTKGLCILHYQYNKQKEFNKVKTKSYSIILDEIGSIYNQYSKFKDLIPETLSSLYNWSNSLIRWNKEV